MGPPLTGAGETSALDSSSGGSGLLKSFGDRAVEYRTLDELEYAAAPIGGGGAADSLRPGM
jgi:hypothetical protein